MSRLWMPNDIPLIFSFENGVVYFEVEEAQVSFDGKLIDSSTIEGTINRDDGESGSFTYTRVK